MARLSGTKLAAKVVVAVGIVLSMLFAGAAPIDFGNGSLKLTAQR
jgi:hypothetical protein